MDQIQIIPDDPYKHLVEEIHDLQKLIDRRFPEQEGPRAVVGDIYNLFDLELQIWGRQEFGEQENDELNEMISEAQSQRSRIVPFLRETANWVDPNLSTDFDMPDAGSGEWFGILVYVKILNEFSRKVEFPPEPTVTSDQVAIPTDIEDAKTPEDANPTKAANPDEEEDNRPTCQICAEKYEGGDEDVSSPWHRLCPECLKEDNDPACQICAEKYANGDKDVSFPCHDDHRMCTDCLKAMHCWQLHSRVFIKAHNLSTGVTYNEPVE
ncbi:uncharacterized protein MELLADRAFT_59995 [Melampsora larici-populina 98AG31]|uniref:RING-type domain-containing protein n=1 Tax=Melampsora larici-populina (strain 98AG31 / pathotype 3-4-7) TaxID=747676 RepID=F4R9K6_MELLP|nr:uncharacterized protein MELLADRAFT_59995 [Melampsora larici-populina 98AG31]EGG10995.1 hypothetical protein MELLADRAFT_59995 [Melampsora larici-populina 98AG31]